MPNTTTNEANRKPKIEAARRQRIGNYISRIGAIISKHFNYKKKMTHSEVLNCVVHLLKEYVGFKKGVVQNDNENLKENMTILQQRCDYYAKLLDDAGVCKCRSWCKLNSSADVYVQTEECFDRTVGIGNVIILADCSSFSTRLKECTKNVKFRPILPKVQSVSSERSNAPEEINNEPVVVDITSIPTPVDIRPSSPVVTPPNSVFIPSTQTAFSQDASSQTNIFHRTDHLSACNFMKIDRSTSPVLLVPINTCESGVPRRGKPSETEQCLGTTGSNGHNEPSYQSDASFVNTSMLRMRVEDMLQPDATSTARATPSYPPSAPKQPVATASNSGFNRGNMMPAVNDGPLYNNSIAFHGAAQPTPVYQGSRSTCSQMNAAAAAAASGTPFYATPATQESSQFSYNVNDQSAFGYRPNGASYDAGVTSSKFEHTPMTAISSAATTTSSSGFYSYNNYWCWPTDGAVPNRNNDYCRPHHVSNSDHRHHHHQQQHRSSTVKGHSQQRVQSFQIASMFPDEPDPSNNPLTPSASTSCFSSCDQRTLWPTQSQGQGQQQSSAADLTTPGFSLFYPSFEQPEYRRLVTDNVESNDNFGTTSTFSFLPYLN